MLYFSFYFTFHFFTYYNNKIPFTLKQLKEDRIKITPKLLKKEEDFSPISPELIKDLRDRTLFATPDWYRFIKKNQHRIDWSLLSGNPNAIKILENNKDKIDWQLLCYNKNAIKLLKERIEYEKLYHQKNQIMIIQ